MLQKSGLKGYRISQAEADTWADSLPRRRRCGCRHWHWAPSVSATISAYMPGAR